MTQFTKLSFVMLLGLVFLADGGCDDDDEPIDEGMCGCISHGLAVFLESSTDLTNLLEYLDSSNWDCTDEVIEENHNISCNEDYYSEHEESKCQNDAVKLEKELQEQQLSASVTCVCTELC